MQSLEIGSVGELRKLRPRLIKSYLIEPKRPGLPTEIILGRLTLNHGECRSMTLNGADFSGINAFEMER